MVKGVSRYKCPTCVTRLGFQETKLGIVYLCTLNKVIGSDTNNESMVVEDNLHRLVAKLCNKINELAKCQKTLKTEDVLRLQLSQNTELLGKECSPLEVTGWPARQSSTFPAVLRNPSNSIISTVLRVSVDNQLNLLFSATLKFNNGHSSRPTKG